MNLHISYEIETFAVIENCNSATTGDDIKIAASEGRGGDS